MSLLKNYTNDLTKSRTTPLLIELSKKDLDSLCLNDICGLNISLATARGVYDTKVINKNETNVIFIDADKVTNLEGAYLFEELLTIIKIPIKNIKNINIVKKGLSRVLSSLTGGISKTLFGDFVDDKIELVFGAFMDDVNDLLVEEGIDQLDLGAELIDEINSRVLDAINNKTIQTIQDKKNDNIYLSAGSKKIIEELSKNFVEESTPAEYIRLAIKIMLSIAIDMPTAIFIKNPHKLDKDSLAILSLLLSYSKDKKEDNQHTKLSIIYAYEDEEFQPYNVKEEKYEESKKLLAEQRIFTQRYAMLERPTSDIPRIAVKSHMFVGREQEIESLLQRYKYSEANKDIATLEIISGEPGIGKTKLVKKHLYNLLVTNPKQIQLTLLNQVGHSSSNTGISSLINSILEETSRLENLRTTKKVTVENAKEYVPNAIFNVIKSYLEIDSAIDVYNLAEDILTIDGKIDNQKNMAQGNTDFNKSEDKKLKQYLKLNGAIKKLQNELSNKDIPLVLFIDDLQWIDDESAEYILTQFINDIDKFNVHIVSTIRPSDSTTSLKKLYANKEQHPYTIAFLKKAGIRIYEEDENTKKKEIAIKSDIDTDKLDFKQRKELKGLDSNTLTSLISQVIKPIVSNDNTKQYTLAKTIITELNNDETKDEVNTLFAVETINMLCDRKFYFTKDEHDIETLKVKSQLILTDGILKFNNISNDEMEVVIKDTFKKLREGYEKSFIHNNAEKKDLAPTFNLMAYAVLEERLNILKIYFAEHGNAAVNTLLFSSWLGSSFNAEIIKKLLESLSKTDDKLLQPLKKYIQISDQNVSLNFIHYEIMEEIYQILNRYENMNYSYSHSHSLLSIFFDNELKYLIGSIFSNNIASVNRTYSYVADKIISFDDNILPLDYAMLYLHNIALKALNNQRRFDNFDIIYNWYMNKYSSLYDDKKFKIIDYSLSTMIQHVENEYNIIKTDEWSEKYFNILWNGVSLNDRLFKPEAKLYIKKIHQVIQFISDTNEGNKLKGELFYKTGGYKYLHVSYKEGLKELLLSVKYLKCIKRNPTEKDIFTDAQATLSYAYGRIGELLQRSVSELKPLKRDNRLSKALNYHKKSLLIIEDLQTDFPDNLTFLTKTGVVYERIGQAYRLLEDDVNTLHNFKKALDIKKKYFNLSNQSFGYRKILIVLSDFYREQNMQNEADLLILKANDLTTTIDMNKYIENKDQYQLESYLKIYKQCHIIDPSGEYIQNIQIIEEVLKDRGLKSEY